MTMGSDQAFLPQLNRLSICYGSSFPVLQHKLVYFIFYFILNF
jgi:hypothetical protein